MPEMVDGNLRLPAPTVDDGARFIAGAVVGNKHFVRLALLQHDATQDLGQRRRLLVGADDQ